MRRHAIKIVIRLQGRYARNQRLQRTWTPPALSISPRAAIENAPAMAILSKSPAQYLMVRNIHRAMLLRGPKPKASNNPSAIDAMMSKQANHHRNINEKRQVA